VTWLPPISLSARTAPSLTDNVAPTSANEGRYVSSCPHRLPLEIFLEVGVSHRIALFCLVSVFRASSEARLREWGFFSLVYVNDLVDPNVTESSFICPRKENLLNVRLFLSIALAKPIAPTTRTINCAPLICLRCPAEHVPWLRTSCLSLSLPSVEDIGSRIGGLFTVKVESIDEAAW